MEHDASDVLICKQDVPILLTMVAIFAETSVEWRGRLRKYAWRRFDYNI